MGGARVQSLPSQGRWLGEAETERPQQICDDLSVCFADSSPSRGAFGALPTRKGWKRGAECDRMEKTNEEKGGNCL